jgi:hypothetical protein
VPAASIRKKFMGFATFATTRVGLTFYLGVIVHWLPLARWKPIEGMNETIE